MTPEQRIARALHELERQRTSGEWNLCRVRDLLTGEEPAHLRDDGVLYTPDAELAELLATRYNLGDASVRTA